MGRWRFQSFLNARNGRLFVGYQNRPQSQRNGPNALVPTADQRASIPASLVRPEALTLLNYYPSPNFVGNPRYNYQVPLVGSIHQDSLQVRLNQTINRRNQFAGDLRVQSSRRDNTNMFGFLDTTTSLGLNAGATWTHRLGSRAFLNLRYQFNRSSSQTNPYFAYRTDVAAKASIQGTGRDPRDWGPPTLAFANGITSLGDAVASVRHDQTGTATGISSGAAVRTI